MAAIKPFSYLTGETRPPQKSGFRRPVEVYGTAVQENASPRPTRNPKTSGGDGSKTIQPPRPELPNKDSSSHRALNDVVHRDNDDSQLQGNRRVQQPATDSEYKREQQKAIDLKNRLDIATAAAPDRTAPPSRTNEQQADRYLVVDVPCTSRDHFYGKRQIDGQTGKVKTDSNPDASDSGQFLHDPWGENRRRKEIAIGQNSTSSSSAAAAASCEVAVPYSYTEPMRPAPLLYGAAQTSSDGQYRKKTGSGQEAIDDDLDYLCPAPSSTADTLLDNFILVGGPSSSKAESNGGQVVAGEPTKRLKLQELFDPPPLPPPPVPTPPRRFSIHGVTNTESSDYQHHHHHVVLDNKTSNSNGSSNYSGIKGPAVTLGNSDYRMTGSGTETGSNLHDYRSVSNSTDRTGKASVVADYSKRCRCDRKLCLAIVITALITSVICLGSGFIAGWFGNEMRKGNGQC